VACFGSTISGSTGTASLPLDDLLSAQEAWLAAATAYLAAVSDATDNHG
jgi:hypothetical protein